MKSSIAPASLHEQPLVAAALAGGAGRLSTRVGYVPCIFLTFTILAGEVRTSAGFGRVSTLAFLLAMLDFGRGNDTVDCEGVTSVLSRLPIVLLLGSGGCIGCISPLVSILTLESRFCPRMIGVVGLRCWPCCWLVKNGA